MEIKYLGGNCFRIRTKEKYLLLGEPSGKVEVDVALAIKSKSRVSAKSRKKPFFVPGPGEYEIGGVEIWGKGDKYWQIKANGWRICLMADGWKLPDEKKIDFLGQVDILFLIISQGKEGAKEAAEAIKRISPLIVIPGKEGEDGLSLDWVKPFLDVVDKENLKPEEKLVIKAKELPEETKIVLLKPKNG